MVHFSSRSSDETGAATIAPPEVGHDRVHAETKYAAFLSYSHRDSNWCRWLHRRLESYRIGNDLSARIADGRPRTLRPIFRDREEFGAGERLGTQTATALEQSAALIVLCSPHAAGSAYVNEEIRLFKWLHPKRPVIPLILSGTPGHPDQECFPPALRFALEDDGKITSQPVQVLAGDARNSGDGRTLALAKVVAALLGLDTDAVHNRALRLQRRRQAWWSAGLAVLVLTFAALAGWAELQRRGAVTSRALVMVSIEKLFFGIYDNYQGTQNAPPPALRGILLEARRMLDDIRPAIPPHEFPHTLAANLSCTMAGINKDLGAAKLAAQFLLECEAAFRDLRNGNARPDLKKAFRAFAAYVDTKGVSFGEAPAEDIVSWFKEVIDHAASNTVDPADYDGLGMATSAVSRALLMNGKWAEALTWNERSQKYWRAVLEIDRWSGSAQYRLALSLGDAGRLQLLLREVSQAIVSLREAHELFTLRLERHKQDDNERYSRLVIGYHLVEALYFAKEVEAAIPFIATMTDDIRRLTQYVGSSAPLSRTAKEIASRLVDLGRENDRISQPANQFAAAVLALPGIR